MSSNKLIWRIYPKWADGTPKAQRHNSLLGGVLAVTKADAEAEAAAGHWRFKELAMDSYTGEFHAHN